MAMRRPKVRPTRQGLWMKAERKRRGWSFDALRAAMRRAGTYVPSARTLRNVESGETEVPHVPVQHAIATALGGDVNELWPE